VFKFRWFPVFMFNFICMVNFFQNLIPPPSPLAESLCDVKKKKHFTKNLLQAQLSVLFDEMGCKCFSGYTMI
jgi:hypothetical protein